MSDAREANRQEMMAAMRKSYIDIEHLSSEIVKIEVMTPEGEEIRYTTTVKDALNMLKGERDD